MSVKPESVTGNCQIKNVNNEPLNFINYFNNYYVSLWEKLAATFPDVNCQDSDLERGNQDTFLLEFLSLYEQMV